MSRQKLVAISLFALSGLVFGQANAQGAAPVKAMPVVATVTSSAPAGPTRTLTTTYKGSWNGFSALNVAMSATVSPNTYTAKADITPSGLTSLTSHLKKSTTYTAQSRGAVSASGSLLPVQYIHQGGKKRRKVDVEFGAKDVKTTVTPDFGSYGDPPATMAQKLEAMDTLSAIMSVVNSNPADVCKQTLKVFDGRARYNLVLSPLGNEKVRTDGFKGNAQKCHVDYKRIAGYGKPGEKEEKSLVSKPFTIWVAPASNGLMAPVKVTIDSTWGEISLSLDSWSAANS